MCGPYSMQDAYAGVQPGEPRTPKEVLAQARVLISARENWMRHAMSHCYWSEAKQAQVCTYCSLGALLEIGRKWGLPDGLIRDARRALSNQMRVGVALPFHSVAGFNDTHSHEEVLAAWDRAIASLA